MSKKLFQVVALEENPTLWKRKRRNSQLPLSRNIMLVPMKILAKTTTSCFSLGLNPPNSKGPGSSLLLPPTQREMISHGAVSYPPTTNWRLLKGRRFGQIGEANFGSLPSLKLKGNKEPGFLQGFGG